MTDLSTTSGSGGVLSDFGYQYDKLGLLQSASESLATSAVTGTATITPTGTITGTATALITGTATVTPTASATIARTATITPTAAATATLVGMLVQPSSALQDDGSRLVAQQAGAAMAAGGQPVHSVADDAALIAPGTSGGIIPDVSTNTNTPVPPTATKTKTPVPPTATKTWTCPDLMET